MKTISSFSLPSELQASAMVMRNLSLFLPLICSVASPRSGGALWKGDEFLLASVSTFHFCNKGTFVDRRVQEVCRRPRCIQKYMLQNCTLYIWSWRCEEGCGLPPVWGIKKGRLEKLKRWGFCSYTFTRCMTGFCLSRICQMVWSLEGISTCCSWGTHLLLNHRSDYFIFSCILWAEWDWFFWNFV